MGDRVKEAQRNKEILIGTAIMLLVFAILLILAYLLIFSRYL
jgi:hypothetical protein